MAKETTFTASCVCKFQVEGYRQLEQGASMWALSQMYGVFTLAVIALVRWAQ